MNRVFLLLVCGLTAVAAADTAQKEQKEVDTDGPMFAASAVSAAALVVAAEIGDMTFCLAAIMAMRAPKIEVWIGAMAANALMTALTTGLGVVAPLLFPVAITRYGAIALFTFYGLTMLRKAWRMKATSGDDDDDDDDDNSEFDEAEEALASKGGVATASGNLLMSPVVWQALTMTFLAEWGDRSQVAVVVMAAAKNPYGVIAGGIAGHAVSTAVAVVGGEALARSVSERTVTLVGGLLFLLFAVTTAVDA